MTATSRAAEDESPGQGTAPTAEATQAAAPAETQSLIGIRVDGGGCAVCGAELAPGSALLRRVRYAPGAVAVHREASVPADERDRDLRDAAQLPASVEHVRRRRRRDPTDRLWRRPIGRARQPEQGADRQHSASRCRRQRLQRDWRVGWEWRLRVLWLRVLWLGWLWLGWLRVRWLRIGIGWLRVRWLRIGLEELR